MGNNNSTEICHRKGGKERKKDKKHWSNATQAIWTKKNTVGRGSQRWRHGGGAVTIGPEKGGGGRKANGGQTGSHGHGGSLGDSARAKGGGTPALAVITA